MVSLMKRRLLSWNCSGLAADNPKEMVFVGMKIIRSITRERVFMVSVSVQNNYASSILEVFAHLVNCTMREKTKSNTKTVLQR